MIYLRLFLLFFLWGGFFFCEGELRAEESTLPLPAVLKEAPTVSASETETAPATEKATPKDEKTKKDKTEDKKTENDKSPAAAPRPLSSVPTPPAPAIAPEQAPKSTSTTPEYFICQMQAKVLPNKVHAFVMPELGTLSQVVLHTDKLAKDALVGIINASQLARETEELELQLEHERLTQKNTILQLVRQQEEIEFLLSLSKEERKYLGKDSVDMDKRALQNLKDRIALLEAQLELKARKMRADFNKKKENFELRMPFDGKIQYHFPLPHSPEEELRFPPSTLLASVADDSSYYVGINMVNPELIKLHPQALTLLLNLGSGESLKADYSHKRIEKSNQGESLVYFFALKKEEFERAHELLGANCIARLFYKTDKPLLYKHKMALVAQNTTQAYTTWDEWVKDNAPKHKILFVGETHLALEPLTDEASTQPLSEKETAPPSEKAPL